MQQTFFNKGKVSNLITFGLLVFGLLIVIISCHQGLRARNGAVGVGRGTTDAMVFSSLAILIFNLLLTMLMQLIFPVGMAMN